MYKIQNNNSTAAQIMIWMILSFILIYLGPKSWTLVHIISWSLLNTMLYALLANLNMYILFPKFLQNGSITIYITSLIGTCLIATPIKQLLNQYLCNLEPGTYESWMLDQRFHFISLVVVASLSTLVRLPLDWLKVQNEKRSLLTKNIESELLFLKNQINPHFLFNTLNNLYALTLKKSDYAPELVLKLSDMLRYMLYECNETVVPLSKEIHYINNYIALEKIRLSQQADIQIEIVGDPTNINVAPLLFIPFIENSFKHGLKYSTTDSYIHIQFRIEDEIHFSIVNSKHIHIPGMNKPKSVGGIGLNNVRKRLELIYPNSHELDIIDQLDHYQVNLILKNIIISK
ncbi:MAG: histidine kinase [Saprospiraceae bacterium]